MSGHVTAVIGLCHNRSLQHIKRAAGACEMLADDMGVNLCSRDITVAQQLLYRADISASLQQLGSKGMTKGMAVDPFKADRCT